MTHFFAGLAIGVLIATAGFVAFYFSRRETLYQAVVRAKIGEESVMVSSRRVWRNKDSALYDLPIVERDFGRKFPDGVPDAQMVFAVSLPSSLAEASFLRKKQER